MGKRLEIKPGDKFSRLSIIREIDPIIYGKYKKRNFLCLCVCGTITEARLENLRRNHTTSCGCMREIAASKAKKIHGFAGTRIYSIWTGMKNRCYNHNVKSYSNYGEKGVVVCKEWHEFIPFKEWALANGYEDHLTIERVDPYGNYEPSNCTWIPKSEQGKNKRRRKSND